jgi:maleylpyruvate isomerase
MAADTSPEEYRQWSRSAVGELIRAVDSLSDADVRAPSPLPGWTRGHVLTDLARNGEGSTRLLGRARTGESSNEYESVAARAAAIEEDAGRPAALRPARRP